MIILNAAHANDTVKESLMNERHYTKNFVDLQHLVFCVQVSVSNNLSKQSNKIHLTLNSLGSRVWYTQNNFVRTLLISSLVLGLNSSSLHQNSLCLSFQAASASWRWASRNFRSSPMRLTWWRADYTRHQVRTWYFHLIPIF